MHIENIEYSFFKRRLLISLSANFDVEKQELEAKN